VIRTIADFTALWKNEAESTQKVLDAFTDASLGQSVANDHRTLGRLAWHITGTVREMMEKTGLHVAGPDEGAPVPSSAKAIATAYAKSAQSLLDAVNKQWTDATLLESDEMYGERWQRGQTALILVLHQAHHRGMMIVLMRQAGLRVPGIYGPAKEDWAGYGMPAPAI
jgi:uncharacterized damage-inducible protein DinB